MTRPSGISFSNGPKSNSEFQEYFQNIVEKYVLPMQTKVFPAGTILRNFKEIVWKNGNSYLRTLGTCSIRIIIIGKILEPYSSYDIRVIGNAGYRMLSGELIAVNGNNIR
jgi:radical SAM superfamily enzyme with C-terminal helix-hairpin-helix motif